MDLVAGGKEMLLSTVLQSGSKREILRIEGPELLGLDSKDLLVPSLEEAAARIAILVASPHAMKRYHCLGSQSSSR